MNYFYVDTEEVQLIRYLPKRHVALVVHNVATQFIGHRQPPEYFRGRDNYTCTRDAQTTSQNTISDKTARGSGVVPALEQSQSFFPSVVITTNLDRPV